MNISAAKPLRNDCCEVFKNLAILVAIAVNGDGYRGALGAAEGIREDKGSCVSFF